MPEFILNLFVQSIAQKLFFFFNLFRSVLDVFVFHVNAPWQMLTVFVTQRRVTAVTSHVSILYLCIRLAFRETTIELDGK